MTQQSSQSADATIRMTRAITRADATYRFLQLNCLAHWAVDDETAEGFNQRTALHQDYILQWKPTICFLEEVDGPLTLPEGCLSLGQTLLETNLYQSVHHAKYNEKGDETWILVNPKEASILSHEVLRYDNATSSQFALIAVVQWTSSKDECLVVATHAKAGRTDEWESVRVSHSAQLLGHLASNEQYRALVEQGKVVWGGDLNAGPSSYDGKYPCQWYPHLFNDETGIATKVGLQSAYKQHAGSEPLFTTVKHRHGALISQCIDYIFVASKWAVVYAAPLPTLDDVPSCALPCPNWASDHLPLVVDLREVL